ncbi:MAG TPA: protoporphyrinogen oxidase [Propionibacteriaceae bacterium]|nr:protoporphyrinogen oxidase [Propionibacteriaceae bacterium]
MARVVVVGGGISGLVAARKLAHSGFDVILAEAGRAWGGKIASTLLDGVRVDTGAEALVARRPEALALIDSVGLSDRRVHPSDAKPDLLVGGRLHPMPRSVSGVPTDLDQLGGLLSREGLSRARAEPKDSGGPAGDVAIGRLVDKHLGPEVTDKVVEPVVGGVYAGHSRDLSLAALSLPLYLKASTGGSLVDHALAIANAAPPGPVFVGLHGGVSTLVDGLIHQLTESGAVLRRETTVRELVPSRHGYELTWTSAGGEGRLITDAVVIATPWPVAARLLATEPHLARELAGVPYASMAIITMVVRGMRANSSGLLAPPAELPSVKAMTYSSTKWPWLADQTSAAWGNGTSVVRASVGRLGEEHLLQVDDRSLVARTFAEAQTTPDWRQAVLVAGHVQRWGGALPQYQLGHRELVARVREQVAAVRGVALCGAALDGIGVAACIGSGTEAARKIIADLGGRKLNPLSLEETA